MQRVSPTSSPGVATGVHQAGSPGLPRRRGTLLALFPHGDDIVDLLAAVPIQHPGYLLLSFTPIFTQKPTCGGTETFQPGSLPATHVASVVVGFTRA